MVEKSENEWIAEIALDLVQILERSPEELQLHYETEPDPFSLDFIFHPASVKESPIAQNGDAGGHSPTAAKVIPKAKANLPPNFLCHLCENRMYPIRRFYREGTLPVLFLHYNGSLSGNQVPVDRSQNQIFGSTEEDALFERLCGASGWEKEQFHFQELPACHFSVNPNEWELRIKNCLLHVKKRVEESKIQLLIFSGNAALLFFGKEEAIRRAEEMKIFPVTIDGLKMPAFVVRSPASLVALEKRRGSADEEKKKELLAEEKKIKTAIVQAFQEAKRFLEKES